MPTPCRRSYAGITCLGNAIITFKNENAVTGGSNSPAIQVAKHVGEGEGFTLTIQGDGSLTATGGSGAAGIGSGENGSCGNITINGGQVTAKGNYGIRADAGDIILGWKNPGDFIYASSYKAGNSKNVKIADGQSFTYVNTNDLLGGTLSADQVTAIAGKTLTPVSDKITVPAYRWATYYSDQPLTLGTNHVYCLKETGEIVDNCQKRPQSLFQEEELSVDECADYLQQTVDLLHTQNPEMHIVLTVSPIRYRKYGYHGSQLSKAILLLAVDKVISLHSPLTTLHLNYFPAYEIVNDELRDYRFYQADMLHPSDQAVTYIWERLSDTYLSDEAKSFLKEWAPLKAVLNHKPFNPESEEYQALIDKTMLKVCELQKKYPNFAV